MLRFDFLSKPLGFLLNIIYENIAFRNYGLAIIFFTVIVKLILLPMAIKQHNVTSKINKIQPQLEELQKKYKKDKEKLNLELMKLYKDNNVNPAGGCLPLFIQMPILIALYSVFVRPLTYMLGYSAAQISELANQLGVGATAVTEIAIIKAKPELINMIFPAPGFGINLGDTPSAIKSIGLLSIPIIAALTTYLSTKVMTPKKKEGEKPSAQESTQNSMMAVFPIMTGFFAFNLPAGLGLYWIVSNIFQIFQQYFLRNLMSKEKEAAKNNAK